jgi:hypothetical protein
MQNNKSNHRRKKFVIMKLFYHFQKEAGILCLKKEIFPLISNNNTIMV